MPDSCMVRNVTAAIIVDRDIRNTTPRDNGSRLECVFVLDIALPANSLWPTYLAVPARDGSLLVTRGAPQIAPDPS